jgi:hypothetical protein
MDKTTLYLPTELAASLREAARRSGRPQAELVREALETYLSRQPQPKPRSVALGRDPELAARDSEGWLEQNWQRA